MRLPKKQVVYKVTLQFPTGITRTVQVRASESRVAEQRALKRNPAAIRVANCKRDV